MSVSSFIHFLNESPTAWHAVEQVIKILLSQGFVEIKETDDWGSLKKGGKYFTLRNGSSLAAFILPEEKFHKALLLGSHSDSPSLKLKPQPLFMKDNLVMLALEMYGAPLLTSWFNRDLAIAGRVVVEEKKGELKTVLVNVKESPVVLAQLAIHLDRDVNEKGFTVNKQEALNAIVGVSHTLPSLSQLLKIEGKVLSHDLFLYPIEEAALIGLEGELLAGYRLDNLTSVYGSVEVFKTKLPSKDTLQMMVLWDHEEIGSQSYFSAGSPFLKDILERVVKDVEVRHQLLARSLCLSIDLAHATHPNYNDKHEPRHPLRFGGGVVLKYSSGHRYATDALTAAGLIRIAKEKGFPLQYFVTHGNIPAGSTIGPIHAGVTGMPTVDIGIPQLSMHSCREVISVEDFLYLLKLLDCVFDI